MKRTWTDQDLAQAVKTSTSVDGVLRNLGLTTSGSNNAAISSKIEALRLDTSHFRGAGRKSSLRVGWTETDLRKAVAKATSLRSVISQLGLATDSGGTNTQIRAKIQELGLDTSHFKGRAWNKGKKQDEAPGPPNRAP